VHSSTVSFSHFSTSSIVTLSGKKRYLSMHVHCCASTMIQKFCVLYTQ
jgi:hypothetical protein